MQEPLAISPWGRGHRHRTKQAHAARDDGGGHGCEWIWLGRLVQISNRDRSAGTGGVVRTLCQSEVFSDLTASLHCEINTPTCTTRRYQSAVNSGRKKGASAILHQETGPLQLSRSLALLPLPGPRTCCCTSLSTRLTAPRVLESSNNHRSSRCGALGVSFILCAARIRCLRQGFRESTAPMAVPGSPARGGEEEVPLSITRSKTVGSRASTRPPASISVHPSRRPRLLHTLSPAAALVRVLHRDSSTRLNTTASFPLLDAGKTPHALPLVNSHQPGLACGSCRPGAGLLVAGGGSVTTAPVSTASHHRRICLRRDRSAVMYNVVHAGFAFRVRKEGGLLP